MVLLAQAQNLISFFVSLELLSVPLYVLCGSARAASESLESGLKYLIVGSLGSATLLYGLAFIYGGSGSTDFSGIRDAVGSGLTDDPLLLIGIALAATGLAFKLSIAPFHQWTPDVYQGAPDPGDGVHGGGDEGGRVLRPRALLRGRPRPGGRQLAAGARGARRRLDRGRQHRRPRPELAEAPARLLGGRAGRLHARRPRSPRREPGVNALVFYLAAYALMNLAAFAVIVDPRARDRVTATTSRPFQGLGRDRPALAWPLTISMLALAGLPATAGFIGKLYLIEATVDADYTWLGVMIAIGTMISLAYYLRVIAAVWMRPAAEPLAPGYGRAGDGRRLAGGRRAPSGDVRRPVGPRPKGTRCIVILASAALAAAATVFFGVIPSPLVDWASNAGQSLAPFLS